MYLEFLSAEQYFKYTRGKEDSFCACCPFPCEKILDGICISEGAADHVPTCFFFLPEQHLRSLSLVLELSVEVSQIYYFVSY